MFEETALAAEVAAVVGERPTSVAVVERGRNNLVARVTVGGRPFVVKQYFRHREDLRDRLATEFDLLSFLWSQGLRCVPQPIARGDEAGIGVYAFVEGEPLTPGSVTLADGLELAELLARMAALRTAAGAAALPNASDAAFSLRSYVDGLERRLACLRDAGTAPASFVERELAPTLDVVRTTVERRARALGVAFDADAAERTLSPGDIGFHNALRRPDGSLAFVDFEYGGWDEPAHVVASACVPPGVPLPRRCHLHVATTLIDRLGGGTELAARVRLVYPLLALKWSLILLNEFVAVGRARRSHAGALDGDFARSQIVKARDQLLLARDSVADSFLDELTATSR